MTEPITLYYNPNSRAAIARWMLEEVGAEYSIQPISFEKREHKSPTFLALNPMGKLPTLTVGDTVITEVPAILAWLADAYPAAGLAPPLGSTARGTYYRWLFFGGSCYEPALLDVMLARPEPTRAGVTGWAPYQQVLDVLEQALTPGPYLLGEQVCAADIYIAASLDWSAAFGAPGLRERPLLMQYRQRLTARPAYARSLGDDATADNAE